MAAFPVLQMRARQALRQSPIPALRRLQVEETDHQVVLSGAVSSYYLKQLAQETIMPILDGRELHNQLTVSK
jgi:osmotically-inducible protein OsmY